MFIPLLPQALKDILYICQNHLNKAIDVLAALNDIAETEPNFLRGNIMDLATLAKKICLESDI